MLSGFFVHAGCAISGSARASRAGEGVLAFANFCGQIRHIRTAAGVVRHVRLNDINDPRSLLAYLEVMKWAMAISEFPPLIVKRKSLRHSLETQRACL
jgi:hypothetical protein